MLTAGIAFPTIAGIDFSQSNLAIDEGYAMGELVASQALFDAMFVDSKPFFSKAYRMATA